MYREKRILAVIPARAGSKGVPRKNLRVIFGKPLIAWTIQEARKSRYLDSVIVSSDDLEVIKLCESLGCGAPFIRPSEFATDTSPMIETAIHAIRMVPGFDFLVLLQPTSPLRTAQDIDACIERCIDAGASSAISVVEAAKSPYWMFQMEPEGHLLPLFPKEAEIGRRQDLPPAYLPNGAVYVTRTESLVSERRIVTRNAVGIVMPPSRSIDIDSESDLKTAEAILKETAIE